MGYARVTLAHIAAEAEVPLGNVYYYFKTKSAIAASVVQAWRDRSELIFSELDKHRSPQLRLLELLKRSDAAKMTYTELGCPLANLARDLLAEGEDDLSELAKHIYDGLYDWTELQFRQLGHTKAAARSHSRFLVAGLHGAILMAHAIQDPVLLTEQIRQLKRWLTALSEEKA